MLDRGRGPDRWNVWRPTVDLCRHGDLVVHRLELLHGSHERALVDVVSDDIRAQSPETDVRPHVMDFGDPWDFGLVYGALHDFARDYPFDPDREDYLVHVTTGTHVAQICLFLLTETRYFPARLLQTAPPKRQRRASPGRSPSSTSTCRSTTGSPRASGSEQREDLSFLKSGIETRSPLFNDLIARIEQVAGRIGGAAPADGPDGRGQVEARAADLRSEEGAPAGDRTVRRGELRDGAGRRRDVDAVRPRPRLVHRGDA